jgi:hypothetical protein
MRLLHKYRLVILRVKARDTLHAELCMCDLRSDHGMRCGRFRDGETTGSGAGGRNAPAAQSEEEESWNKGLR